MRAAALTLIIICEVVIALTRNTDIDTGGLSFLTTLIIVVVSAFASSALFRNIKSLTLAKNYAISSIIGVAAGLSYFAWIGDHLDFMLQWIKDYGLYFMLGIIFLSALVLYFNHGKKPAAKVEPAPEPAPMPVDDHDHPKKEALA